LFRISQEALTNVARHASATHVQVTVHASENRLRLVVADNGCGLKDDPATPVQPPDADSRPGIGMVGMRARARSIGGELVLRSGADHGPGLSRGLSIEVQLPISAREEELDGKPDIQKNPHPVGG